MRIRQARKAAQLTQEQLAAISGVSQSAISLAETGDTNEMRADTLLRLCSALGLDPFEVWTGATQALKGLAGAPHEVVAVWDSMTPETRSAWVAAGRGMVLAQAKPSAANPFPHVKLPKSSAKTGQ